MPKIIMTVGLPGSGKSTWSQKHSEETGAILLSSDNMKVEMYGDNAEEVFQKNTNDFWNHLYDSAKNLLNNGQDVIIDATNTSQKKRIYFCDQLFKDYRKEVVYFDTPVGECFYRNIGRERVVPYEVIERMYKNLQIPTYSEGWDDVKIIHFDKYAERFTNEDRINIETSLVNISLSYQDFINLTEIIPEMFNCVDLPQDNPHHTFSVSRHIYYVYRYVMENYKYKDTDDLYMMLWTAVFHDIGKAFCKSFVSYKGEESNYANFIGHENVSAQIACHWLWRFGYDQEFILKVVETVQLHMRLMNASSEKSIKKLRNLVGEKVFEQLVFFFDADKSAK